MKWALLSAALSSVASLAVAAPVEGPEPLAAQAHVARAKEIAAKDLAPIADGYLCRAPAAGNAFVLSMLQKAGPVSGKAFDNLYYVGGVFVGAWALDTRDGIVLIDAMNNEKDARETVEPGLRALGLDPARIKAVIVTHGHYDHFGGARYFQDRYGAKVAMSAADWDFAYDEDIRIKNGWPKVEPPKRDLVVEDGQILRYGDETIRVVLTPGHTPGTISLILTARDKGKPRTMSLWGGTAIPINGKGAAEYHDSFHKLWAAGKAAGAEGGLSTHPFVDDTLGRLQQKKPFAIGRAGYERFMAVHEECILAQQARFQAWGW